MSIVYSKLYYKPNIKHGSNEENKLNKLNKKDILKDLIKNHNYNSSTGTAFIKP